MGRGEEGSGKEMLQRIGGRGALRELKQILGQDRKRKEKIVSNFTKTCKVSLCGKSSLQGSKERIKMIDFSVTDMMSQTCRVNLNKTDKFDLKAWNSSEQRLGLSFTEVLRQGLPR